MNPEYNLFSLHIIEKFNNNSLITWTYPSITDALKQYLLQNCLTDNQQKMDFKYYRLEKQWIYVWEHVKEQKIYALIVVTKCFSPDKYNRFGSHLCKIYEMSYKPIELLKIFLGAFTTGCYKVQQNGTHSQKNIFFSENAIAKEETFAELVAAFDVEIVLIFNALLLKKRIFVYHTSCASLLKHIEVMTQLMPVKLRDPNEYLFPCIHNIAMELKGRNFFLAGLMDKNINIKAEAYDLFVNLQNSTIKISPYSKDIFQMTKWHREIATILTSADTSDKIVVLHKKILDLLANLKTFAISSSGDADGSSMVTLDTLRAKKFPPAMESFLFNLALAENIMML